MTEEQVSDLWLQFQFLHPERKPAEATIVDDEFEAYEKELAEESQGVLYDTTEVIPYGEAAPVFLTDDQWEEVT